MPSIFIGNPYILESFEELISLLNNKKYMPNVSWLIWSSGFLCFLEEEEEEEEDTCIKSPKCNRLLCQ